ncbi:MAG: hypothetical protein ACREDR_49200, partial [Blastocatellia bacterium]
IPLTSETRSFTSISRFVEWRRGTAEYNENQEADPSEFEISGEIGISKVVRAERVWPSAVYKS